MGNEIIHLVSGKTVLAEVNGFTMDGQRGYVLLAVDTGNLYRSLRESSEIEVEKRTDGSWWEVNNSTRKQACTKEFNECTGRRSKIGSA